MDWIKHNIIRKQAKKQIKMSKESNVEVVGWNHEPMKEPEDRWGWLVELVRLKGRATRRLVKDPEDRRGWSVE